MNARISFRVLRTAIAAMLIGACGGDHGNDSGSGLKGALALSSHYVRVSFSKDVGPSELDATRYSITDPAGRALSVLEARPEVRSGIPDVSRTVVLVTEAQQAVWYTLAMDRPIASASEGRREGRRYAPPAGPDGGGSETVDFPGSTIGETYLESAVAVDNTSVVLLFSGKLGTNASNPSFYKIEYPNLNITNLEISDDETAVRLTTSPQEAIEYTVFIWGVEDKGSKLLDPTRSSAPFQGRAARDETRPKLVRASALDNSTVLLSFDSALSDDAADPSHFTIVPADDDTADPLTISGAMLSQFGTQMLLQTMPMVAGQEYKVTVGTGVKDVARNSMDPEANWATFTLPILDDGESLPRVVGAVSSGNKGVLVRFSKAMDDAAEQAANYSIVQENVNPEAGALRVAAAKFVDERRAAVQLTTLSQNEVTYRVSVSNVADLSGNPLAPRTLGVDPTSATFAGTPPGPGDQADSDGDGLDDNVEQLGWLVTVTLVNGSTTTRQVTSEPGDPSQDVDAQVNLNARDTDGDMLSDRIERLLGSDPRQADTDGDALSDFEEYNLTFTDPNVVDSDGDGIDDFLEVEYFKTNALVEDSDGDGYPDPEELFERNRDPRIADLPSHDIQVGQVRLQIDERFTYTNEDGQTDSQTSSSIAELATSSSTTRFSSDQLRGWFEGGLSECQSDCIPTEHAPWGPPFMISTWMGRIRAMSGFERITQTSEESSAEAQKVFANSLEKAREISSSSGVTREVYGASITVDVTLQNTSNVAFSLSDVEISVSAQDPDDATTLVPVATLVPEGTLLTGQSPIYNIGPGQSRGPVIFTNREVFPGLVEDLMRAPRGLVFRVANYNLSTADGRNFAFGIQDVRDRTVGIFIDPGSGNAEQAQVVTAAVLDREREDYRCPATAGDKANEPCDFPDNGVDDDEDGSTDEPDCDGCAGGSIVGGLANYGGTGPTGGIPLEFLLESSLGLRKTRPQAFLAGENGIADTEASGDDVQVVPVGISGLSPNSVVVDAGRNQVLDTLPAAGDVYRTAPDGILAGPDGEVDSVVSGDDVQLVPVGTRGVPEDTVVIGAGEDGELQSTPYDDDVADVVTGFEVSSTCGADTPFAIMCGPNNKADTTAEDGICTRTYGAAVTGQKCTDDSDCGTDPNKLVCSDNGAACASDGDCQDPATCGAPKGVCTGDNQAIDKGDACGRDEAAVLPEDPAKSRVVVSAPALGDVFLGPGTPCTRDSDCNYQISPGVFSTGGKCDGPQKLVRINNRRDGQFRRAWTVLVSNDVKFETDFSLLRVRAGDQIALSFAQDVDRDGLISEVEFLAGSSDFKKDTDDDTLSDFSEVRIGWEVGVVGSPLRRVFSDPRRPDSDLDGLGDKEEFDVRPLRCSCGAIGPKSVVGFTGLAACSSKEQCGAGEECLDAVLCTPADFVSGDACPPCSTDQTVNRTDPRRKDTDGDGVSDFEEVFGYLTGAGIVDTRLAKVILAGSDQTADTVACPDNHCDGSSQHCMTDGDCLNRRCIRPRSSSGQYCDDVQVVPPGSGVSSSRTVVVAQGIVGNKKGWAFSSAANGDDLFSTGNALGDSALAGDDVLVVSPDEKVYVEGKMQCVDGSQFDNGLAERFLMCSVIKPGANGVLESFVSFDDVIVPGGRGQKLEFSDPLNADTDMDEVQDGYERLFGSSPNDPGDTGLAGDSDQDGLSDSLESRLGWVVNGKTVYSNPYLPDTDLDGLPDYAERHLPCIMGATWAECPTDPTRADSDGDGISDLDELSEQQLALLEEWNGFFPGYFLEPDDSQQYGTDPTKPDTDGDGLDDWQEIFGGWVVTLGDGSVRNVRSDPSKKDTDGDGVTDKDEQTRKTDPTAPDTDGDGRSDGVETQPGAETDPLVPDRLVTVELERIEVSAITDKGGTDQGEFAWFFLVRKNGGDPVLVSNARNFSRADGKTYGVCEVDPEKRDCTGTCTQLNGLSPDKIEDCCNARSDCEYDGTASQCKMKPAGDDTVQYYGNGCQEACIDIVDKKCCNDPEETRTKTGTKKNPDGSETDTYTTERRRGDCRAASFQPMNLRYDNCPAISLNPSDGKTGPYYALYIAPMTGTYTPPFPHLQGKHSFPLKEGEYFSVEGVVFEGDDVSADCNQAKEFVPTWFISGCYSRFNKVYAYGELASGQVAAIFGDNPPDIDSDTGDTCAWQLYATLRIQ